MTPVVVDPAGSRHPVGVEGGAGLGPEDALLDATWRRSAAAERYLSSPVRGSCDGQLHVDGVGAVPGGQLGALLGADHVVGRGDDLVEGEGLVVAESGEGFEAGHRPLRSTRAGEAGGRPARAS